MDFKNVVLVLLLPLLINCNNGRYISPKECLCRDTINIKNDYGNKDFCYSGSRLFPSARLKEIEVLKLVEKTKVFLILEKSDTLYMLSGRDLFSVNLNTNQYLPSFNDSLIKAYAGNKYQLTIDPDPPGWTALENEKDSFIVSLGEGNFSYWVNGIITDTIFQMKDGLKIGIDKKKFFQLQGISFHYEKSNFTVLFTSMFESNVSWYYRYFCSNNSDKIYCHPDGFHMVTHLKYFLTFKDNKLVKIKIHS